MKTDVTISSAYGLMFCIEINVHVQREIKLYTIKVGSQYDTTPCIALHRLYVNACCNAMRRYNRLGFYPCIPLHCILAADHKKIAKTFN